MNFELPLTEGRACSAPGHRGGIISQGQTAEKVILRGDRVEQFCISFPLPVSSGNKVLLLLLLFMHIYGYYHIFGSVFLVVIRSRSSS